MVNSTSAFKWEWRCLLSGFVSKSGKCAKRIHPPELVVHNYSKGARVVLQNIIIDSEIKPASAPHANRTAIVSDEEIVVGIRSDPADERAAWTIRYWSIRIVRGIRLAVWSVAPVWSPADFSARLEVHILARLDGDAGVGPLHIRCD